MEGKTGKLCFGGAVSHPGEARPAIALPAIPGSWHRLSQSMLNSRNSNKPAECCLLSLIPTSFCLSFGAEELPCK